MWRQNTRTRTEQGHPLFPMSTCPSERSRQERLKSNEVDNEVEDIHYLNEVEDIHYLGDN
jgi:hypothetical protein